VFCNHSPLPLAPTEQSVPTILAGYLSPPEGWGCATATGSATKPSAERFIRFIRFIRLPYRLTSTIMARQHIERHVMVETDTYGREVTRRAGDHPANPR
jgi:hypothetical protein